MLIDDDDDDSAFDPINIVLMLNMFKPSHSVFLVKQLSHFCED